MMAVNSSQYQLEFTMTNVYHKTVCPDGTVIIILEEEIMNMLLAATTENPGGMSLITIVLIYAVIFGVMYLLLIRPRNKEQKQKAQILSQLAVGDSVRTTGGFIGTIIDINDEMVIVEFGNNRNCRIPMVKEAIVEVEKPEDAVRKAEAAETKKAEKEKKNK